MNPISWVESWFIMVKMILILVLLLLCSCMPSPRTRLPSSTEEIVGSGGGGEGASDGQDSTTGGGDSNVSGNEYYDDGEPELRHVIDPFTGSYQTKVTIPKNFTGTLYLAGLNISSLNERLVHVRFRFGIGMESIILPATIARGSGITPQTDVEVVVLHMLDQPFKNLRIPYQLFDYNDYDENDDGVEEGDPTIDPLDGGLYCRGVRLSYDPTFVATTAYPYCNYDGAVCKYAYASIADSGLYYESVSGSGTFDVAKIPSQPQIDLYGGGYGQPGTAFQSEALKRCLPDNNDLSNFSGVFADYAVDGGGNPIATLSWGDVFYVGSTRYSYKGPFYPKNQSDWDISGNALFSSASGAGLFQERFEVGTTNPAKGYKSFLFPRAGTMSLSKDIQYFGSPDGSNLPFDSRVLMSLDSNGTSNYMDGCNMRVTSIHPYTGEGLGSCNVTGIVDLVELDPITSDIKEIISSSIKVKIQLIRENESSYIGSDEVLYTALKTCENSRSCGSEECCFNNRCWSKELVSQCPEDAGVEGNLGVGAACTSDFQCSSLCCNQSLGVCAVHINSDTETVLCSKSPGQQCVAKEYCRQEYVSVCKIYKTYVDTQGVQHCARQCYPTAMFGDCVNGVCVPPVAPSVPDFDPDDCSEAIDPPTS